MLNFGTTIADKNTGYSGKITGRAEYDTGTILYLIENLDASGHPVEMWIDEKRIEIKN